jgi:hypothetical protein
VSILKEDFDKSVEYERRIVAFYDILGWKNKIEWAGQDAQRLKLLRGTVLSFASYSEIQQGSDIRMTTFSDNVVVSGPVEERLVPGFLLRLCYMQFAAALYGMFVRGGITIGDIVHDDTVVFGPALNRAYDFGKQGSNQSSSTVGPNSCVG